MKIAALLLLFPAFIGSTEDFSISTCGQRPLVWVTMNSRIIGGKDALPGAWPWLVSMQIPKRDGGHRHSCGGSLLNERWVLTAAHCFKSTSKKYDEWKLILGANQLSELGPEVEARQIRTVIKHEHYNPRREENDIALIEMDQPVMASDYIQPACLPDLSANIESYSRCHIAGWGVTQEHSSAAADILQEAAVHVIPKATCNSSDWYNGAVNSYNLCAGAEEGGIDSCQGDSGGPLMCIDPETEKNIVLGITSWGRGCAQKKKPGIYTSTQSFLDWISEKIKSNPKPTEPPLLTGQTWGMELPDAMSEFLSDQQEVQQIPSQVDTLLSHETEQRMDSKAHVQHGKSGLISVHGAVGTKILLLCNTAILVLFQTHLWVQ